MFNNLESRAQSIHENTSAIADKLINFVLQKYHQLKGSTGKLLGSLLTQEQTNPVKVQIQIDGQKVYAQQSGSPPTVNLLPEQLDQVMLGLEKPELTEGSIYILVDNKPILHIENGQIIRDELGLLETPTQDIKISTNLESEQNVSPGIFINQAGSLLIAQYGYQVSENISTFHGHNYSYEQNNQSFSIHAYGRGTVFKDGLFTDLATEQDQRIIKELPQKVEQEFNQSQQHKKQQSLVLKNKLN